MSKLVQVKRCDIVRGECGNVNKCALARALNRTFKQKGWAIGAWDDIQSPYGKCYRTLARDGGKVNRFMNRFDSTATGKTIKFSIIPND